MNEEDFCKFLKAEYIRYMNYPDRELTMQGGFEMLLRFYLPLKEANEFIKRITYDPKYR